MDRPIIICGLGRMGARVLEYLRAAGKSAVVIDQRCQPDDPRLRGAKVLQADFCKPEVLESAGVREAGGVLILTQDDLVNIATMLTIRSLNPAVRIVVRLFNQNLLDRLGRAIRNVHALSTSKLTAPILAMTALTGQGLGMFRLPAGTGEEEDEGSWYHVVELRVGAGSKEIGRPLGEAFNPERFGVLSHRRLKEASRLLLDVDLKKPLASGDRVVLCGRRQDVAERLSHEQGDDFPHLRWAGWLRRQWRGVVRALWEMDRGMMICTLILILTILGSALIFYFGVAKFSFADSLFRTISVMATGSSVGMHEEDYDTAGIKIFVSVLRLLGIALTAAFTALLTNFLIRARLAGAFEMRRIPEGGHIVVCGLSAVGFRVVQELIRAGERVVAVELSEENRFTTTARRLGAAVIIGDATVREVLRQAHVSEARATIAATSNDLVNLEMALLVRDINPSQRIVLLQSDPQLANLLRESADIRLAVSLPGLAAPAFLAALYGDRVLSVFFVGGMLLAVLDLLIQDEDPLIGESVDGVARAYSLLPAAVLSSTKEPIASKMGHRLSAGDRLAVILDLANLEKLLRRQHSTP